jgi:hypothetical protein
LRREDQVFKVSKSDLAILFRFSKTSMLFGLDDDQAPLVVRIRGPRNNHQRAPGQRLLVWMEV